MAKQLTHQVCVEQKISKERVLEFIKQFPETKKNFGILTSDGSVFSSNIEELKKLYDTWPE